MEAIDEALIETRCAGQGETGEQAPMQTKSHYYNGNQNRGAKDSANPPSAPRERFIAAKTRPPANNAIASEVAAPAA